MTTPLMVEPVTADDWIQAYADLIERAQEIGRLEAIKEADHLGHEDITQAFKELPGEELIFQALTERFEQRLRERLAG